jgi:DNA repair exonuclease SbcCD ATPase subunit
MADPLSATANIAAVIGLVDVVCTVGKETYSFTAAVKNASKEIKDLQSELQGIESILENARQCCEKRYGGLPTTEGSLAMDSIGTTLRRIEGEYETLSQIITRTTQDKIGRPRTQSVHKLMGSISWFMNRDIEESCDELERYKSQLCVDFLILGR